MDETVEVNCVTQTSETRPGPNAEQISADMNPNGSTSNTVHDKRAKNVKNKTGNEKSQKRENQMKKRKSAMPEANVAHPPVSEMVMNSIKALKKRNGASFEDISKYMEGKYVVNMKVLKSHVNKFLQKSIDKGMLEKTNGAAGEGKYKMKKLESIKKDSQNLRRKEGKEKLKKKALTTKKQTKK